MKLHSQTHANAYRFAAFNGLIPEQERIINAIKASTVLEAVSLSWKLEKCCTQPMIFRSSTTGEIRLYEARCKSRACPRCSQFRAWATMHRARVLIARMDSPRFTTLTARSNDQSLRSQMQFLKSAFTKLRRSQIWKDHVDGGIYTWEITWNAETKQWHPHLHAVIDGKYFHQRHLLAAWEKCLKDSAGVHIRKVNSTTQAARYISSYITKSSSIANLPDTKIFEWAHAIHGLRLFQPFGNLHGAALGTDDDDYVPQIMSAWFSPNDLAWDYQHFDLVAERLLEHLMAINGKEVNRNRSLACELQGWRIMRKYEKAPKKRPRKPIIEPETQLFLPAEIDQSSSPKPTTR